MLTLDPWPTERAASPEKIGGWDTGRSPDQYVEPRRWEALMEGDGEYPLVNIQKTMENHHVSWVNPLFLWSFSIAMLNYQRVIHWE